MLRKRNAAQSTPTHLSVRAASNKMYLPCMSANLIVPLAARLCWSPKLGVGTLKLEDLSRSLAPYQSSLATVSAGTEVMSCRTREQLATVHDLPPLRSESHRDTDLHF